ncbi:hypothetical protein D3C81_1382470 [compost metagenome]
MAMPITPQVMIATPNISMMLRSWVKNMNNRMAVTAPEEFCTGDASESSIYLNPI